MTIPFSLLEVTLGSPASPGVQRTRLTQYKLHLAPGVHYKWSIALVPDFEDRSKDLIVSSAIERIAPSDDLRAQLASAGNARLPALYGAKLSD